MKFSYFAAFASLALLSCSVQPEGGDIGEIATKAPDADALLDAALKGTNRSDEDRARDAWRHPRETLRFFGVAPAMTVVEIWPGGGWYTRILAPYLKSGGGIYYAAQIDPAAGERAAAAVDRFRTDFAAADVYGAVRITTLGAGEIAPEDSADVILTFRNVHNWMSRGTAEENFKTFYRALKAGGVLGVVEHRADEGASDQDASSGYVKESTVKTIAEAAGFEFVESSEINANPNDTRDHPYGVWTLPPVRRSSPSPGQENPNFDRAKYDAIGESDRMTLKFIKPRQ